MKYEPSPIPTGLPGRIASWLASELRRIANAFDGVDKLSLNPEGSEPARYAVGDMRYADGTNWDPGSGAGVYVREAAGWTKLGGSGGASLALGDLTDVGTATPTNRHALVGDGTDFDTRVLVEADISDLQSYSTDTPVWPTGEGREGSPYFDIDDQKTDGVYKMHSHVNHANSPLDGLGYGTLQVIDNSDVHSQVYHSRADNGRLYVRCRAGDFAGSWNRLWSDADFAEVSGSDTAVTTSGYSVVSNITLSNGIVQSFTTREIDRQRMYDARADGDVTPDDLPDRSLYTTFTDDIASSPNTWDGVLNVKGWSDSYGAWQLISSCSNPVANSNLFFRSGKDATWGNLREVITVDENGDVDLDYDLRVKGGAHFRVYDSTDLDYFQITHTGSNSQLYSHNGAMQIYASNDSVQFLSGAIVHVYDSSNTDWIRFRHDTSNSHIESNSGHIYYAPASGINIFFESGTTSYARVYDSTGTDYIQMSDSGSNGQISTNNNPLRISSGADAVQFIGGTYVRIYDSTNVDYIQFEHDGTDAEIIVNNGDPYYDSTIIDPSVSQVSNKTGNYTLVYADKGKLIRATSGTLTFTIPANSSVAYPVGTWLAFENDSGNDLTIAITTDTLEDTSGSAGSKTLGDHGRAYAHKVTSTKWRYLG